MRGSAGCNTYGADYALDDSSLIFESIAVTEMACGGPAGIMEQETRYLDFLGDMTAYRIYGSQLWLEAGDGRALVFTASERRDCAGPNAFPIEEAELIWPELREVQPDQVAPGDEVEILGSGGHLYWDNECGEFWLESARDFQLFFDGEPAGSITCYANTCVTDLSVPEDALSGTHVISVEGGSSLSIEVSSDSASSEDAESPEVGSVQSLKGYELYSWQMEGDWYFALVVGTNRLKTYEEVASSEVRVQGVEALKRELDQLPSGQWLFWSARHVSNMTLPPDETINEVSAYCEQLGIQLSIDR